MIGTQPSPQAEPAPAGASKRNLLYVDDEKSNLIVFRATFSKYYNVIEATGAREAMDILKTQPVPVMVADQRMPDMTGVELCEVVAREYPHMVRMILTGYAEPEAMSDAINKGHVYSFITKPWEKASLLSVLRRGFEAHDLAMANNAMIERLAHADRCAALGQMAAGVAHEIRNQLFVLPLVELLESKYQDDAELLELAGIARTTHTRLNELVNEIMSFVRRDDSSVRHIRVNLADLVRETAVLASLDRSIRRDAVRLELADEPYVRCHKSKLQQVIINLLRNAADAARKDESLRIDVAVTESENQAELSITDNGAGIAPEILERIWEPFFTTKGASGNGLGLDICKGIVEAHRGSITCDSRPGKGTCFRVRLPVADEPEAP